MFDEKAPVKHQGFVPGHIRYTFVQKQPVNWFQNPKAYDRDQKRCAGYA
jgi:hypothetical protein